MRGQKITKRVAFPSSSRGKTGNHHIATCYCRSMPTYAGRGVDQREARMNFD
jgi:hypothetical protein